MYKYRPDPDNDGYMELCCYKCGSFHLHIPDQGPYVCDDCKYQEGDDPKERDWNVTSQIDDAPGEPRRA